MPEGVNGGRWVRGVFFGLGLAVGMLVAVASGSAYVGSKVAAMESHISSPVIHETPEVKSERIRRTVDREIAPQLQDIKERLVRIERKLDP